MPSDPGAARHRPRSSWFGVLVAGVLIASVAGYVVGSRVRSPEDVVAAKKAPPQSLITAKVRQGTLSSEETFAGKVGWRATSAVEIEPPDGEMRSVVTATPLARGGRVGAGAVLLEVSDRPVFVLTGAVPMLRDLRPGDSGADVRRLQVGLRRAGHSTPLTGKVDAGTWAAIKALYAASGYVLPEAGADRATRVPASEIAFVPSLPATLVSYTAGVGKAAQGAVAQVGTGGLVVRANVPVSWRGRLREGSGHEARVQIRDEGAGPRDAVVIRVGKAHLVEGAGEVVLVAVRASKAAVTRWKSGDQVEVILSDPAAPSGLLVPLAALYSSADAGDFVRVLRGRSEKRIPVRLMATANGSAVVEGTEPGALEQGDDVIVGVEREGR